ncbi:MAG: hypothetical protein JNM18_00925 [Planctomycetaceae bacterium]|nr:hypothetical protein [Planctomycetaceae bacterium]
MSAHHTELELRRRQISPQLLNVLKSMGVVDDGDDHFRQSQTYTRDALQLLDRGVGLGNTSPTFYLVD